MSEALLYIRNNPGVIRDLVGQHLILTGAALGIALAIALPVSLLVYRVRWLAVPILGVLSVLYTIPSLALIILLIPAFGLTRTSVVIALVVYAQIVLVRNILAGLGSVDPATIEAARGMGMNGLADMVARAVSACVADHPRGLAHRGSRDHRHRRNRGEIRRGRPRHPALRGHRHKAQRQNPRGRNRGVVARVCRQWSRADPRTPPEPGSPCAPPVGTRPCPRRTTRNRANGARLTGRTPISSALTPNGAAALLSHGDGEHSVCVIVKRGEVGIAIERFQREPRRGKQQFQFVPRDEAHREGYHDARERTPRPGAVVKPRRIYRLRCGMIERRNETVYAISFGVEKRRFMRERAVVSREQVRAGVNEIEDQSASGPQMRRDSPQRREMRGVIRQ